ncbi:hypothetical protein BDV96DRAFT_624997 [Lophiotrema nucula]|uniref:Ferulic acid decarboxylase 1 n=1 Tax=Lophiotrema nucula TaxID=690887 RepID=A0A6A5YMT1_9PLEO|nr:hypothetical protein BDV96DRAFT_624997 [Lophiotrema nucula]
MSASGLAMRAFSVYSASAHLGFRLFVDALRKEKDLVNINEEADPELEVAAFTRRAYEQKAKAPLFNNVKGAHGGLSSPGGLSKDTKASHRRLALHLGLEPTAGPKEIIDFMLKAKTQKPIPPTYVEDGPCKEVKLLGFDVDLAKLPVPLLNKADGGHYIQTLGINIVQHFSWTNWSIARTMIHDKNRIAGLIMKPQHIACIHEKWVDMPLPVGVTEAEYVGSLCGSPLELVKCETNDTYVPANSEIVLEGPFGEMHGYSFLDENSQQPLYTVSATTHRKDTILPICFPGKASGPDETHTMIGTLASAEMRQLLQDEGFPIKQVFALYESQFIWAAIQVDRDALSRLKTNAKEFCERVGDLVFRHKSGMQIHRLLIVGDDIDPFNFNDVMWAYATRCRPAMDEFHFEGVTAYPLVPYMSHGPGTKLTGGKVVSNCLLPEEYEGKQGWVACDFENGYPESIKERVLGRWDSFQLQ